MSLMLILRLFFTSIILRFSASLDSRNISRTNVLFVIFDDLRPELSIYGKDHMITPNFDRLAQRSVVFDHAYCQVAVCNPSRNSLLTGLRPDTIKSFGFDYTYKPYLTFITRMMRSGYKTSGYGKLTHWDGFDKEAYHDHYSGNWYDYQFQELSQMKSSVMPDKNMPEEKFRDYIFTTKAIDAMKNHFFAKELFMVGIGYKLPHTALHVPFKYFDMYRNRSQYMWNAQDDKLRFPINSPLLSFREGDPGSKFAYMNGEGSQRSVRSESPFPSKVKDAAMYKELMWGYSAAVTFLDSQLGRILDAIDELGLWNNLTIVLTSDHGHHNGEKGMWDKWTLFDETTKVPLIIAHPLSPFKGRRYKYPVELVDIFPTLNALLRPPYDKDAIYARKGARHIRKFMPLQGKSLAPAILGNAVASQITSGRTMPDLSPKFALSQMLRCTSSSVNSRSNWTDCDVKKKPPTDEVAVMGYSMRLLSFRYTAWMELDRVTLIPKWDQLPIAEELYDHRRESLGDLGSLETVNVAGSKEFRELLKYLREQLYVYLRETIVYAHSLVKEYSSMLRRLKLVTSSFIDIPLLRNSFQHKRFENKVGKLLGRLRVNAPKEKTAGDRSKSRIRQSNLLFIMYDDLRPELSIYGKDHMITPNFERLAQRSLVFDHAYCQVAVCNPSRDSLLTGLRPDTVGTLGFQSFYAMLDPAYLAFPVHLKRSGYATASYGKIRHWEEPEDKLIWDEHYDGDWYDYQNKETDRMNSSVMPDKKLPEEQFRDYMFTTMTIDTLRRYYRGFLQNQQLFMICAGFKMPHTALHVPFHYFDMYRNRSKQVWNVSHDQRTYPKTSPSQGFRLPANDFVYMKAEGTERGDIGIDKRNGNVEINKEYSLKAYRELMWGYSAAISFVDKQLGRILDVIDELDLWRHLTIVLTSDHGHHNGEKGMWDKWTLFDESTKVPLMIAHPHSPTKGKRYKYPVELLDIYPTLLDLLAIPEKPLELLCTGMKGKKGKFHAYKGRFQQKCLPLQGQSLAPLVLGPKLAMLYRGSRISTRVIGVVANQSAEQFALSQIIKSAPKTKVVLEKGASRRITPDGKGGAVWMDCGYANRTMIDEEVIMGYSLRTLEFRYTAWLLLDRRKLTPLWSHPLLPLDEELYDHRGEALGELGTKELVNLAYEEDFSAILIFYRSKLLSFLRSEVLYEFSSTIQNSTWV